MTHPKTMSIKELRQAAVEAGVPKDQIEDARDGMDPAAELITLIEAQRSLPTVDLQTMSVKELRQAAVEAGVPKDQIEDARDGMDPAAELITLIEAQRSQTRSGLSKRAESWLDTPTDTPTSGDPKSQLLPGIPISVQPLESMVCPPPTQSTSMQPEGNHDGSTNKPPHKPVVTCRKWLVTLVIGLIVAIAAFVAAFFVVPAHTASVDAQIDLAEDPCAGVLCKDHGSCDPETGTCTCAPGYSGGSCDVSCENGWTLLASAWIDSYDSQIDTFFHSKGQFVTPNAFPIHYQQVYLECRRSSGGVQRVLTLTTEQSTARGGALSVSHADYFGGDTVTAGRPGDITMVNGVNWNELHHFSSGLARFIIRQSQVHCARDYASVGGQDDNPDLGQYGRVWVRQGTAQVAASNLPSC